MKNKTIFSSKMNMKGSLEKENNAHMELNMVGEYFILKIKTIISQIYKLC